MDASELERRAAKLEAAQSALVDAEAEVESQVTDLGRRRAAALAAVAEVDAEIKAALPVALRVMSRHRAAELLRCSRQTLYNWEEGR